MKRLLSTLAVLTVLISTATACGDAPSDGETDFTAEQTSATPSAGAETSAPAGPAELVVAPGAIGPVRAGISKADALATGLFDADVEGVEGCTFELRWKQQFEGVDVLTLEDGTISSLGVTTGGPVTAEGVGVGSTLAEVKAAYPDLSAVKKAGFDQAGAFHTIGQDHIGFLFGDATPKTISDAAKVSFMEVTTGDEPELLRSGC
ncbi:hypothetical protein [Aeromicrobium sp. NPDC092404]|uniref:hypothetical protein n=1 Tax=Aeromicrobium sp. NPDC092404 TaxID=3154976 RepID=UPI003446FD99